MTIISTNDVKTTRYVRAKLLQSCPTLCDPMDHCLPASSGPWDSPGKNTGVGCHFLLQGIFPHIAGEFRPLFCTILKN